MSTSGAFGSKKNNTPENWGPEWRLEGIKPEHRYPNPETAIRKEREIQGWKPKRLKGKREVKSTRPGPETCERAHHSRGKQWENFKNAIGQAFQNFTPGETRAIMDGRKIGGTGIFPDWKQEQYENRKTIQKTIYIDTNQNGKETRNTWENNKLIPQPPQEKSKDKNKTTKPKYCTNCNIKLPTNTPNTNTTCNNCNPINPTQINWNP